MYHVGSLPLERAAADAPWETLAGCVLLLSRWRSGLLERGGQLPELKFPCKAFIFSALGLQLPGGYPHRPSAPFYFLQNYSQPSWQEKQYSENKKYSTDRPEGM